jgi:hypothetical protein
MISFGNLRSSGRTICAVLEARKHSGFSMDRRQLVVRTGSEKLKVIALE